MISNISLRKRIAFVALAIAVMLALLGNTGVLAVGGMLDTTFDGDGMVITDFEGDGADAAWALTIQPDGKIIVAGDHGNNTILARYNNDGSLDDTFGTQGKVSTLFGDLPTSVFFIILQPDGKILISGTVYLETEQDMALARFNSDGTPDTSFGTNGWTTVDFYHYSESANTLVLLPDGRIVAGGYVVCVPCLAAAFGLARFNSDGTLDETFGTQGKVITQIGKGSSQINGAVLQPDGKIVVAGLGHNGLNADFTLARYNSDGSLDETFGIQGITLTDFGGSQDTSSGIVRQPDGKLIVGGSRAYGAEGDFALARYNSDGSLDTTFGTGGRVTTDFGTRSDYARDIALQADGKIVLAGISTSDFGLARYNSDGSLDTTFGTGGRVTTDFGDPNDAANGVAIQPDGKIVASGYSGSHIALARYFDTIFEDVTPDHWAWRYIERLFNAGITGGCATNPLRYCPGNSVSRDQMAVFLLRGIHGSSYVPPDVNGNSGFGDVAADSPFAPWIKQLAAEGITSGCGGGNYCPGMAVSRAQMALFLLRAEHGFDYVPPEVGTGTGFADVPPDYPNAAWIKQLVAEGITAGCGNNNYCPANLVTRDQMAVFLVRTFNLP